jgi:hypothetical protein
MATPPAIGNPPPSTNLADGGLSPNTSQSVAMITQLARDGAAQSMASLQGQTIVKPIKATEQAAKDFLG